MKAFDKILNRAELNNLKAIEIDDLLKRYQIKRGINMLSVSRQNKIDMLLAYYKHLFNTNTLFISWNAPDKEKKGRKPKKDNPDKTLPKEEE